MGVGGSDGGLGDEQVLILFWGVGGSGVCLGDEQVPVVDPGFAIGGACTCWGAWTSNMGTFW